MNRRPAAYDFVRYLTSKRTVDDRAINQHVWAAMAAAVHARGPDRGATPRAGDRRRHRHHVVERAVAWSLRPAAPLHYTAIDAEPTNIAVAQTRSDSPAAQLDGAVGGGRSIRFCHPAPLPTT